MAFEHETLIEAGAVVDLPLAELVEQHEELWAAWEKGELLRRLYQVARSAYAESQAPKLLGLRNDEFARLLAEDREARQLWTEGRLQRSIEIKRNLMASIREGKIPVCRIVNLLNRLFETELKSSLPDLGHVPPQTFAAMAGVSRQTIHKWFQLHGLPKNVDGSYDLRVALPWLRRWDRAKIERELKHSKVPVMPSL